MWLLADSGESWSERAEVLRPGDGERIAKVAETVLEVLG